MEWEHHKHASILKFREQQFKSIFTWYIVVHISLWQAEISAFHEQIIITAIFEAIFFIIFHTSDGQIFRFAIFTVIELVELIESTRSHFLNLIFADLVDISLDLVTDKTYSWYSANSMQNNMIQKFSFSLSSLRTLADWLP